MNIGILALIGAAALFIWGMISLGSDPKKKKGDNDDGDWEDFMMEDWDLDD